MTLKDRMKDDFPLLFHEAKSFRNYCIAFFPRLSFILRQGPSMTRSEPWINGNGRNWLANYLTKDMKVFEYGSGGSTIYMAKRVKEISTVESDIYWYSKVIRTIRAMGIKNCRMFYAEAPFSRLNHAPINENMYVSYAEKIKKFPCNYFDLVFVDGRGRELCVRQSLPKIKKGGYLLLDNSDRAEYKAIFDFMKAYPFQTFTSGEMPNATTVWKIN